MTLEPSETVIWLMNKHKLQTHVVINVVTAFLEEPAVMKYWLGKPGL